jgi:antitoxin HicB
MSLDNYLNLPYTTILKRDEDGIFIASVKELKGCMAHGSTEVEALEALSSMKALWLESAIADGDSIPLPENDQDLPSGKWLQRVPRSVHAALVILAESEGVSLNQLVVSVLSREVGQRQNCVTSIQAAPDVADPWSALVDDMPMNWIVQGKVPIIKTEYMDALLDSVATSQKLNKSGLEEYGDGKKEHRGWN